MIRLEQYFKETGPKGPSLDEVVAEVLNEECQDLDWRVAQGQTSNAGFVWVNGVPFVWSLSWDRRKDKSTDFIMEVHQVMPKSLSLKGTRKFNIKESDL